MPSPSPLVFTIAETAAALHLSEASVRSAIKRGEIPAFVCGRRVLVVKSALLERLATGSANGHR